MKRSVIMLTPLLVFVLTASIAWLTGLPDRGGLTGEDPSPRSPRQRVAATVDSGDLSAALLRMERRILPHNPAPPRKTHDAQGMEDAIFSENSPFCGGGMAAIEYACGWAEDAPGDMFAWLVHQNDTKTLYASILFESWAKLDMNAALDAALKVPSLKLRAQALLSSLEVLCASDPDRARDMLVQNLSLFRVDQSGTVFHLFDAGKACRDMMISLPAGEERMHLLAGFLNHMSDPSEAVAYWKGIPESERRGLVAAGFSPSMTQADSYEGLVDLLRERAETSDNPLEAGNFMQNQGEAWAKRDLAGALDWVQAQMKGASRAEWRKKCFQAGIRQDFDTTIRIWQALPEGYVKADVAEAILRAAPGTRKTEAEALLK